MAHILFTQDTSEEETDSIIRILSQIHTAMGSEEDISDQVQVLFIIWNINK